MISPSGPGAKPDRRCSVISLRDAQHQQRRKYTFKHRNSSYTRHKLGDIRRPSDLWQGRQGINCVVVSEEFLLIIGELDFSSGW